MNLKILVLTDGDKVIGMHSKTKDNVLVFVDTLRIVKPDESRIIDIAPLIVPWDTSSINAEVDIYTNNVVASMTPTDEITKYYHKFIMRYKFAIDEPERFNSISKEVLKSLNEEGRGDVSMGEFSALFELRMLEAVEAYSRRKLN